MIKDHSTAMKYTYNHIEEVTVSMKKLFTMTLALVLMASAAACSRGQDSSKECTLDGMSVCYDSATGQYKVEKDAKIRLGGDNDAWGAAIVELWNKTHPELAGVVEFVNAGVSGAADLLATQQGEFADVFMTIDGETPRNASHLLPIDANLAKTIKDNSLESFYKAGNGDNANTIYAPMTYDGMAFVWNKTMLESLGIDTADADGNGLPEAVDTWEEIFAISKSWINNRPTYKGKKVNIMYPLTLTNQWSDYHHLSSAGWHIFASGDATKPGYDDPKFKAGFDFLLAAKDAQISVEESGVLTPAESMAWKWDNVLKEEIAPFGLFGTWMNMKEAVDLTGSEYVLSILPTWKGVNQTPFVKTKGYVINAYTKYRSAATELMRIIYTAGFQSMVDTSSYAPSLVDASALTPNLAERSIQSQLMAAFVYNYPEPALTLPNNSQMKAMDAAFYPIVSDAEKHVWDNTKSIDDAIAELIEVSNSKIAEGNK